MAKLVLDNNKEIQLSQETIKNLINSLGLTEQTFGKGSRFRDKIVGQEYMLVFNHELGKYSLVVLDSGETYTSYSKLKTTKRNLTRFTLNEIENVGNYKLDLDVIERK